VTASAERGEGPTTPLPMAERTRLPPWFTIRPPRAQYPAVRDLLSELRLGTVCREARCPNLAECWSAGAATIMLLGTDCTRRCGFCAVHTKWPRGVVDATEPDRVAEGVRRWGLRYVVLTQVCRDDLADGGADHMARTVTAIRAASPGTLVELLIGDLGGDPTSLARLLEHPPDVLAHNLETVARLSPAARDPRASYARSLEVLRRAKALARGSPVVTKSSIMLGLGETEAELEEALRDLRAAGVDLLTLGQYLRPSPAHRSVDRFVPPEEFDRLGERGRALGFAGVEAGPLVRSSYRAEELYRAARARGSN
jgi:lipoic acid synthetase